MIYTRVERGFYKFHFSRFTSKSREFGAFLEIAWRKGVRYGFKIQFGSRVSETPINTMLSFFGLAFFFSFQFPGLGQFCEWIGRGHRREISLLFHDGIMWWRLWYNDDHGYDVYHRCDSWRQPKLYPWRWGRRKHRPWMCLRQGNIALNPLDAIWGMRYYDFKDIEEKEKTLKMKQFEEDEYPLRLKLQKVYRGREHGPKWARNYKFDHWSVEWEAAGDGIPYRNHSWTANGIRGIIASRVTIDSPANWWIKAIVAIHKKIEEDRVKYKFQPPEKDELDPEWVQPAFEIPQGKNAEKN